MQPEDGFSGIAGNDLVSLLNPEQAGEGAETACSYGKTVCVVFYFCNSVLVALLIPSKVSPAILPPGRTFICNFALPVFTGVSTAKTKFVMESGETFHIFHPFCDVLLC